MASNNIRKLTAILEFCNRIEKTIERFGSNYEAFQTDTDFYDSLFMKMVQLSELTKTVDKAYQEATSDKVPWSNILGSLNHIREGFMAPHHFSVLGIMDDKLLWNSAITDIPKLKTFCEEELSLQRK
jgi:uncharacterized protein with HEPN domain